MKRILFAVPLPYHASYGYWTRDSGLLVLTLRAMGYDAWLVALGNPATETEGAPVLPISIDEMRSAVWWKSQLPDAIVLNLWSAPRNDAVRVAALAATPRVIERLDTDGVRSPRLFPAAYFIRAWASDRDRLPALARWLAVPLAATRTALLYSMPGLMDRRMVATMGRLPVVVAESPMAAQRIRQMFETFAGTKHPVVMIPHPVNVAVIRPGDMPRENRIISVGRWASTQKDYPMLRTILRAFLERHPEWQATVVGGGVPSVDRAARGEEWMQRVTFHDKLEHDQLAIEYRRSKIYLMASRFESFCIAAAEALCCGCSVVGSCDVPSSYYFAELNSGSVAEKRTPDIFQQTLDREVEHWKQGERNPAEIARQWRDRVGAPIVARQIVGLLEGIPNSEDRPPAGAPS